MFDVLQLLSISSKLEQIPQLKQLVSQPEDLIVHHIELIERPQVEK
jgi:hypothetical protein